MDELCAACLCPGRNLYFIGESGVHELYALILNEMQVYNSFDCLQVCWECRALLRRFQQFKNQVKQSYAALQLHLQQDTPKHTLSKPPHLSIHHVTSVHYPPLEIKKELDVEVNVELDDIKTEAVEEHCEPETFVNGLEVEKTEEVTKVSKKKTKKLLKKLKSNKKKKKPKAKEECNFSDNGFSDREAGDFEENAEELKDSKGENSFICSQCGLPFNDKEAFDRHIVVAHVKVAVAVNIKVNTAPKTRVRSKEVLAEKPQCTECGKIFSSRKTYRYHMNVLHKGQNRYPCPRCGKVYQWKSNLGRHLRTHKARDDGELYCELCDKRFASVATYRQHLRVSRSHVPESDFRFICNECGKKFVNKTRLRDHVDWEHLKKIKFKCQLCNKPFKCHTSLYVHMQNVHRNKEKKDNLCHVCGKSYQNAAKLKYHIVAMHTTETPYQCGECTAAFGWYSSLYRHIREVHYKLKGHPKKSRRSKKLPGDLPPLAMPQPGPA